MKLTFVKSDDWIAVYVDGKFMYEDHNVSARTLAALAGIDLEELDVSDDWMERNCGNMPESLHDLKIS